MVVALLVLIALIATAMLSTTRNDRYASVQHQQNVQIDMLVEGAKQIALSKILDDTYGIANSRQLYRPGDASDRASSFDPFDGFSGIYPDAGTTPPLQDDRWLMPRTPSLQFYPVSANAFTPAAYPTNLPAWPTITAPLVGSAFESPASTPKQYIATDNNNGNTWHAYAGIRQFTNASGTVSYGRSDIIPSTLRTASGEEFPALSIYDVVRGQYFSYIAADTDGDGIADAMLQKLPMGPINGVTYYVGYRIVDNNSAINPNVATSAYTDFVNNGANLGLKTPNLALFPSNVGLVEMLRYNTANTGASYGGAGTLASGVGNDFANLLSYRSGSTTNTTAWVPDGIRATSSPKDYPLDDNGTPTTTFNYLLYSDAIWQALSTRIGNPGYSTAGLRFKAFDVGDAMALAYPFGIRNPSASRSELEYQLYYTLYDNQTAESVPVSEFSGRTTGQLIAWYDRLFNWAYNRLPVNANPAPPRTFRPARSIITPYNPTSAYGSMGNLAIPTGSATYDSAYAYATYDSSLNLVTSSVLDLKSPAQRASLNSGSFGELYRGFFSVMAENWKEDQTLPANKLQGSPFSAMIDPAAGLTLHDPYYGMKWTRPLVATYSFVIDAPQRNEVHDLKMFRSSLRNPPGSASGSWAANTARIPPADMVKLRAAIAAANAKEAGEQDYNIDPVDLPISLTNNLGAAVANATARVYGLGPQVFFTEIYAQTDTTSDAGAGSINTRGYIAIEIHNPNPFDVDLTNCQLMGLNRVTSSTAYPVLATNVALPPAVLLNTAVSNLPTGATLSPTIVPANGYLVLENHDTTGAIANAARHRPAMVNNGTMGIGPSGPVTAAPANTNFAFVPGLDTVVYDKETVLMRPLPGSRTGNVVTYGPAAGAGVQVTDYAPLDSFDFTGLILPGGTQPNATAWHYARPSDTVAGSTLTHGWHFVYPGRYNADESYNLALGSLLPGPRQEGTQEAGGTSVDASSNTVTQIGWDPTVAGNKDPWDTIKPQPESSLGTFSYAATGVGTATIAKGTYDNTFPIQLPSQEVLLINSPNNTAPPQLFPRGRFARNGDAMDVPFIGSYRIAVVGAATEYVEFNSVSMDAAMAEDTMVLDDPGVNQGNPPVSAYVPGSDNGSQYREQIGRFCPLPNTDATSLPNDSFLTLNDPAIVYGDFPHYSLTDNDVRSNPAHGQHAQWLAEMRKLNYHWSKDLLDYVGVNSGAPEALQDQPVPGLINVNTANYEVLSMVPWFPGNAAYNGGKDQYTWTVDGTDPRTGVFTVGPNGIPDNEELARAIVTWRDGVVNSPPPNGTPIPGFGPLKSVYDLYKVPAFRSAQAAVFQGLGATEPNDVQGDISPFDLAGAVYDNVRFDSEEQYMLLHRVSNIITTRSDTFTVYLVVQGWRLDSTRPDNPQLVTQRRASMIVDRSRYTPANPSAAIFNVPTQK